MTNAARTSTVSICTFKGATSILYLGYDIGTDTITLLFH